MSVHAETAKMIRKELKILFPMVKFSIRSRTYSGGDSVWIEWMDGPTSKAVNEVIAKYQYGHFNSMEDIYEVTNNRNDLPQVKYVQVHREVSENIQQQLFEHLQRTHFGFDQVTTMDECNDRLKNTCCAWTGREFIDRLLCKADLTKNFTIEQIAIG